MPVSIPHFAKELCICVGVYLLYSSNLQFCFCSCLHFLLVQSLKIRSKRLRLSQVFPGHACAHEHDLLDSRNMLEFFKTYLWTSHSPHFPYVFWPVSCLTQLALPTEAAMMLINYHWPPLTNTHWESSELGQWREGLGMGLCQGAVRKVRSWQFSGNVFFEGASNLLCPFQWLRSGYFSQLLWLWSCWFTRLLNSSGEDESWE